MLPINLFSLPVLLKKQAQAFSCQCGLVKGGDSSYVWAARPSASRSGPVFARFFAGLRPDRS